MRPAKLRFTWGLYSLYKGKHTRSFNISFWRAKEAIQIYLFLLLLEAFLPPVEKDLLLLKEQQGERRRRPHVSTEAGAHDRRLRGPSTQASTSSSLDLCSSNKDQFFLPIKISSFFIERFLDKANMIYESE